MRKRAIGILLIVIAVVGSFTHFFGAPAAVLKKAELANESYQKAIYSKTIYERKTEFNRALTLFSEIEREQNLRSGNGKIYRIIGNIYFELDAYEWALLYYYRAKKLDPSNKEINQSINKAREKLMLPLKEKPTVFNQIFFFHYFLSLPNRLQALFAFGFLAFFFGSAYYWKGSRWRFRLAVCSLGAFLLFSASALYTRYLEPMEAVLIEASMLSHEAGNRKDWVGKEPIQKGTRLHILDVYEDGKWMKVTTSGGQLGFLPVERIRVI